MFDMLKKCSKCLKELDSSSFNKIRRKGAVHLKAACKICQAEYNDKYRISNLDKMRHKQFKWFVDNKEKQYQRVKEYQTLNAESIQEKRKKRLLEDVNYRIARNLRSRLWCALNISKCSVSAVNDLGCSISDFKIHISSLFDEEMTWDNYGEWQIDHVVPLSKFDLTDEDQIRKACNYTNLQPMWAEENASKRNHYSGSYRRKV